MTPLEDQLIELAEGFDFEVKAAQGAGGKGELPKEFWRSYSAFANTNGGVVLLGLREPKPGRFEVLGLSNLDGLKKDLWALLGDRTKVSANLLVEGDVSTVTLEGKQLLSIRIPRAPRRLLPVFIHGNPLSGTFKRMHDGDHHCSEDEVRRMMAEASDTGRDARVLEHFGWDDLDLDTLTGYQTVFRDQKPGHPFSNLGQEEFLKAIRGWGTDRERGAQGLTVAGLLMFGKWRSIVEEFPEYVLDYRDLPVDTRETRYLDRLVTDGLWSGNLYDFYRKVYGKLTADLKVPFRLKGDVRQEETPVHEALREALANCLIHADYAGHRSVRVVKQPGLFEFRNPGRMRVSVEQAILGGESDCRNKILQNMFFLAGRGDRLGSGVPTIVQNWKGQHWRQPELLEELEPEDQTLLRLRMESLLPEDAVQAVEARFGERFQELEEGGRIALVTVAVEGFLTHGRLAQLCDRHANDLSRLLAHLVQEGFLESDRRGRGTSYRFPGTGEHQVADGDWAPRPSIGHDTGLKPSPSSPQSGPSSPHSSPHSGSSSPHYPPQSGSSSPRLNPAIPAIQRPEEDPSLLALAEHVRKGRAREEELRAVILALCDGRFLTLQQLASLMGRAAKGLRDRYLSPMIRAAHLEWRFPNSPNHESQAYRATGKTIEPEREGPAADGANSEPM